jgi:hypothetical protein
MTYKQTLFFIGKCLTINHEKHNKIIVEEELKSNHIDWDAVVKVSSGHYVFPAIYCNLKKADFLHYLPTDLVEYMKHITDLNRERNQQIIEQAKEINKLLLVNNITPIFLKGTGNLLEGLYEDIGERMVGDIDLILSLENVKKADKILRDHKYSSNSIMPIDHRHLPRLRNLDKIVAIEIHKELLIEKYADEFNYIIVEKDTQTINDVNVMSFDNQLALSIIANQINDSGIHYKSIALRNAYDVFLISKRTIAIDAFDKFINLKNPLNCFLASCYEVFNQPKYSAYNSTVEIAAYLNTFKEQLEDKVLRNKSHQKTKRKLFIKSRLDIIYKSFFDKTYRKWLIKRITDKSWRREKLIQLGLKKPKPNP